MELWISLTSMIIIAVINLVGLYTTNFKDNLPQRLGMMLVVLWTASELVTLYIKGTCQSNMLLHVALASYFMGTAVKVVRHVRRTGKAATA